jgi:hypothetical protein
MLRRESQAMIARRAVRVLSFRSKIGCRATCVAINLASDSLIDFELTRLAGHRIAYFVKLQAIPFPFVISLLLLATLAVPTQPYRFKSGQFELWISLPWRRSIPPNPSKPVDDGDGIARAGYFLMPMSAFLPHRFAGFSWGKSRITYWSTIRIEDDPHYYLFVPWWPIAAMGSIVPASVIYRSLRTRHRRRNGRCAKCAYDLRSSQCRCPECGQPIASELHVGA